MRWEDARQQSHAAPKALTACELPLDAALGCTLAERLWSRNPLPPFDNAAMDGYAIRGPGPWRVVGHVLAGAPPPAPLVDGQALEVATGAAVPDGCEGVLPAEDAVRVDGTVTGEAPRGRHVRRSGEECSALTALLPAGTPVTSTVLGLAAAVGWDVLSVHPRPRVAVAVGGDELLTRGLAGQGRIRDALSPLLPGVLRSLDAEVAGVRCLGDDPEATRALLAHVEADVIVTTGGTAGGPADHLRGALRAVGATVVVESVDVRPGHPVLLARLPSGAWLAGLPGNPLAALAGVVTVLGPLREGLTGRARARPGRAVVSAALAAHPSSTCLIPVRRRDGVATPTGFGAPARGAALADGLAVVPPGHDIDAGVTVGVLDLPGSSR